MSDLREAVRAFLAERDDFIRALKNCTNADDDGDYWRWQGHAQARRVFGEALERAGIDLTAEPAPIEQARDEYSDQMNLELRQSIAARVLSAMDVDQYLIDAVRNATPPKDES